MAIRIALRKSSWINTEGRLLLDLYIATQVFCSSEFTRLGSNWDIVLMSAGHVALKRSLRVNAGLFDPALNAACVTDGKKDRIKRIFMLDLSISF